jgi:deoxyhypusine synthase
MNHRQHRPDCPGPDKWLEGQMIEPLELAGNEQVADLIDRVYARSGFNARRLAAGAKLFQRMIEADATIALTVAGAMTPIGMSGVFTALIERGFVDFVIATGANVYHDLHRAFNFPMVQGSPEVDDNELADVGVARIYDVFISDQDTLMATDRIIFDAVRRFDTSKPFSTARLHYHLGEAVAKRAPHPEKSFVVSAVKHDVPIYTSSPGDSSIGMNLIVPQLFGQEVNLSPVLDVIETAALVRDAAKNGVVQIGGGSPKNFYLQTQPTLHQILLDAKGGHDFFLQLTTDSPHWGGLSGATASEARSWGKIRDAHSDNVVVYSCASITLPLIAQYVLARCTPRTHRRLMKRLDRICDALGDAARANPELRAQYSGVVDAVPPPEEA